MYPTYITKMNQPYKESISPIISTILEKIGQRHRSVRELVNKEGLKQSFGIMKSPSNHSKSMNQLQVFLSTEQFLRDVYHKHHK